MKVCNLFRKWKVRSSVSLVSSSFLGILYDKHDVQIDISAQAETWKMQPIFTRETTKFTWKVWKGMATLNVTQWYTIYCYCRTTLLHSIQRVVNLLTVIPLLLTSNYSHSENVKMQNSLNFTGNDRYSKRGFMCEFERKEINFDLFSQFWRVFAKFHKVTIF